MGIPRFGRAQLRIMEVLCSADGEVTAKQITEQLNETEAISLSTVQTLLRRMRKKDAVGRRKVAGDSNFYYFPKEAIEDTKVGLMDILRGMFGGSDEELASFLIHRGKISPEGLDRLRKDLEDRKPK